MSLNRIAATLAVALCAAGPLAAQNIVLNVNGGGYTHLANLNSSGTVDFKPGYNLGGSLGLEFNKYIGLHGDFTYARASARGPSPLSGNDFNRYFYGAHLEGRYPFSSGVTPFGFAGAGAVTVEQVGTVTTSVPRFTRFAGMAGLGLGYQPAGSRVEIFAEGKTLLYKWDVAGFDRTQADVTYSLGLAYRIAL